MPTYPKVEFSNLYPGLSFSEQKARQFFDHLFSLYPNQFNGILSVVFLPEDQHCEIHGKFLQDYRPTDVITFPADEQEGHAGEILVSVDQAVIESSQRNLDLREEISLYLIHGWLHLVGFDDLDESERKIIRIEERRAMDLTRKLNLWPDFLLACSSDQ